MMKNMSKGISLAIAVVLAACGGGGAKGGGGGDTLPSGGLTKNKKEMSKIAKNAPPPPTVEPVRKQVDVSETDKAKFDKAAKAYAEVVKEAEVAGWTKDLCGKAAGIWDRAAGDLPKMAEARFNVGAAWSMCGEDSKAEKEYNAALKINGAFAPALANLGEIYLRGHNVEQAKRWFDQALKADQNNAAAHNNLAWLVYQQMRAATSEKEQDRLEEECLEHLRTALAVEADNVQAFNTFALVYLEGSEKNQSRLDISQLLIDQAKKKNDKFAPLYVTSGLLALRRKNVSVALAEFNKAIALNPNITEARMNIGSLGIGFRKYEEAKAQFEFVLKKEPKNYDAKIGLGVALRGIAALTKDLEALKAAEKAYEEARTMQPNNGAAYYNLGLLWAEYKLVILPPEDYDGQIKAGKQAVTYFETFLAKGGPKKETDDAKERVDNLKKLVKTFEEIKALPPEPEPTPEPPPAPAPTPAPEGGAAPKNP